MFLIVIGHFAWQTNWNFSSSTFLPLESSIHSLWIGGKLGVNLFVLISGYFLYTSRFKIKSFLKVWLTAYFYALLVFIFAWRAGIISDIPKAVIKTLFLSSSGKLNWFVTAYLLMYLLSPYVNVGLKNINEIQHRKLLFILILFFSVFRTIFHNGSVGTSGNDAIWLLIVYCCGAYIRRFEKTTISKFKTKWIYILLIFFLTISIFSVFGIDYIISLFNIKGSNLYGWFIDGFSPLQLCSAVLIFILFLRIKPFYNHFINVIASTTFSIYLIHANLLLVSWLWNDVVRGNRFENSPFVLIYGVLISIVIFVICSIIDLIVKKAFKKPRNLIISGISKFKIWSFFE